MTLPAVIGGLVTGAMVLVALIGLARWRALDSGGRWMVAGVWAAVLTSLVMLAMVLNRVVTRPVHEIQLLATTALTLIGFGQWQPSRRVRIGLFAAAGVYAAIWTGVLVTEQWTGNFPTVSGPIAHMMKVAAAGYTLIALVRVTPYQWTRYLWFWFATATMLIDGMEVVLYPLFQRMFGVRDDLVLAAYVFQQLVGLVGYMLMARGLWKAAPTRPATGPAGALR